MSQHHQMWKCASVWNCYTALSWFKLQFLSTDHFVIWHASKAMTGEIPAKVRMLRIFIKAKRSFWGHGQSYQNEVLTFILMDLQSVSCMSPETADCWNMSTCGWDLPKCPPSRSWNPLREEVWCMMVIYVVLKTFKIFTFTQTVNASC